MGDKCSTGLKFLSVRHVCLLRTKESNEILNLVIPVVIMSK